ncbi:alcohol dehydrogenase catalytic domain-containing protein [Priestia megaterium]|uniref:alcohol dehydrogenase catalytic domain-containing protein n=1 Tax=Priestia megaterium TaxID=1404 RepID=UPI002E20176E|nr:alcohol dehydrogenase catalytic domain-containing protein [Priestia megaterium]MED4292068.1 alcohol dehydrogenase catalytic domain-containing protein [Priestia megaterium]MED4298434.1 alcohol dehydrogenase catalytic domain-containing protein [Priestia megaterium]
MVLTFTLSDDKYELDRHKPTDPFLIIGSDGAGIVEAAQENVLNIHVGDEVMINPGICRFF